MPIGMSIPSCTAPGAPSLPNARNTMLVLIAQSGPTFVAVHVSELQEPTTQEYDPDDANWIVAVGVRVGPVTLVFTLVQPATHMTAMRTVATNVFTPAVSLASVAGLQHPRSTVWTGWRTGRVATVSAGVRFACGRRCMIEEVKALSWPT
jgi:hypothetical protein